MRSRGTDAEVRRDRDLIEAGLSEPADGVRDYGDCACAVRPERSSGEACDGLGCLIAIGEEDCVGQICATDVVWAGIAVIPGAVSDRLSVGEHNCPGERDRRSMPESGAAGPTRHEVSTQNDEREAVGRGRMPRMTMAPPQHGQRSGPCDWTVFSGCLADGSAGGMSISSRQSASLAAR